MAEKKKRGPKVVTKEHKAAMAAGRAESRAVSNYLEAMAANKPRRGRKRTPESIKNRLETIEAELEEADMLSRVNLVQERMNLLEELGSLEDKIDLAEFEAEFIAVAANYSERRGITYAAWREIGVPADVLKRAGVGR
jgi:uncharacterized protein YicC (UPF0701 family)